MSLKRSAWKIFLSLAVLCSLTAEFYQHVLKKSVKDQAEYAQQKLSLLDSRMQDALGKIVAFRTDSQFHQFFIHSGNSESGLSFFYYEEGMLRHWSDQEIILPDSMARAHIPQGTALTLPNGVYGVYQKTDGTKNVIGLILLQKNFSFENKYLQNHFNPALGLGREFKIVPENGTYRLATASGKTLIELAPANEVPEALPFGPQSRFYLLAYFFLMCAFYFYFLNGKTQLLRIAMTGLLLFLVRLLMISFRLPGEMYASDFFSPKVYGSSYFFNSIGDVLLNALTLTTFTAILYSSVTSTPARYLLKKPATYLLLPLLAAPALLFAQVHRLLKDLVLNSKIRFDINIFAWDWNTLAATLSMLLVLWGFCLAAAALLFPFRSLAPGKIKGWPFSREQVSLFALLVLALYSSGLINKYGREKKLETQKLFALRLETRQDPLAEYLFEEFRQKIQTDSLVRNSLLDGSRAQEEVTGILQQNYFTGYFTRFDADISVFDSTNAPLDPRDQDPLSAINERYLQGKATSSPALSQLPEHSGKLRYLSVLPVTDDAGRLMGTIVVRLSSRTTLLPEGYPELLVSNTIVRGDDERNYSYARYSGGSLIYAGGSFPYAFHPSAFGVGRDDDFSTMTVDGYDHLLYCPDPGTLVIVSRPSATFFDRLSLFSFVLLFYLLIYLASFIVLDILQQRNLFRLSLKQRIRSSMMFLVIISFVLIASGTSIYIVRKYEADKNKNILSTLNAMWFAITDRFDFRDGLSTSQGTRRTAELNSLVSSFNLDFNLYDETGTLFYSSQPKLFEKGILSKRINPEALFEMQEDGKTQYVHSESIGKLSYASAYAPFTDRTGNIAGYLNLPYFEKQNELNKEISGFLSALINIYLLLLVFSLLLALIITSRITKPLLLIQEKMGILRLGRRNERIEWKRDDEIGQLVRQYNQMVEALAESAARLSRSERESAWREMARQVAHEIKNPLTPMKLSIQHLQRAWNEKSGNLDELFQRISKTMIEQIDTLSVIASEFGSFAQMPKAKNEPVDLGEMLDSVVNLFAATPGVDISLKKDNTRRTVFADRELLSRAISNLIKNAIQSIPENRHGEVRVSLNTENDMYRISVRDNGTGIPESLMPKIFSPNFTTKTSGTGLGLAIVKSTVEMAGGSIRFETTEGQGSVFIVTLPVFHHDY